MLSCTRIRLAQTQVWPELRNLEAMRPFTAAGMSASAKTIKGALPPSSIEVRFMVAAQSAVSFLPTAVEPVNVSLRTSLLPVRVAPISLVLPHRILMTPSGMPTASA